MIKLKLTIAERLVFRFLRPQASGMADQDIAEELAERVRITNKERADIQMRDLPTGETIWDKAKDKEFDFTDFEVKHLKEQVKRLDEQKRITPQIYSLCKKIQKIEPAKEIKEKEK